MRTMPDELRLKVQLKVAEFTQEIIEEDKDWVAERRTEYLESIIKNLKDKAILWGLRAYRYEGWFKDLIIELCVNPTKQEIKRLNREIDAYQKPQPIDYDKKITDDDIERAASVDCSTLIEAKRQTGKLKLAICPFHNDKNPSLTIYEGKNGYHCFSCGAHGNAIDLVRHLYNYNFKEAVSYLNRY